MSETRIHQGEKLKWLIEKSDYKTQDVSEKMNMARSSLYDLFKKRDIERGLLEDFCKLLTVDIKLFFPDIAGTLNDDKGEYKALQQRAKSLEEMLRDKEVIIIQQQEIIELLKKQKSKTKK